MNKEDVQRNVKCFLTPKVIKGKRVFKIIDGLQYPMSDAHVFHQGYTPDLGETIDAFITMGKAIENDYCHWYALHKQEIHNYYQEKNNS